ncbi:MAG: DUF4430 domain-containing protein [Anaerocolumna sp.]
MKNKNSKNLVLIGTGIFILVVAIMLLLYLTFKPATTEGIKHIVAEVILTDGTSESFEIETSESYLREALESIDLIEGSESEFGLFVTTVNNVTVNDSNQEWWNFTLNGEALNTGVDTTPINDGDHFEITLTVGY